MDTAGPRASLTRWSLLTVAVAVPAWVFILASAVMSRVVDGGIFLSLVGGLRRGLLLYSGVWDNKDPLFFVAMLGASFVSDAGPFVMDWLWIPLASLGGWLVARPLMSGDRALVMGAVLVPLLLVGPFYAAGWTSTPGTALVLLSLGLIMARRGLAAGIVLGLLAFTKLLAWPVGIACLLGVLLFPSMRRIALRALASTVATMTGVIAVLAALGWLMPYLDAIRRNRAYASEVIVYFGYADSPAGHLSRLVGEWQPRHWIAVLVIGLISVLFVGSWLGRPAWRTPERGVLSAWLIVSVVGTFAVLALTYVWPHHAQVVYLPAALAVIGLGALLPDQWPFPGWLAVVVVVAWAASGAGSPATVPDRIRAVRDDVSVRWAEISEVPIDARLINSVPIREFSFARLGTNDDRGFLASVREGATLGCPNFHLYDFSPPEAFSDLLDCVRTVDVVLKTETFDVFAHGGRKASVIPIQEYVAAEFDCLRIADRELCTRKNR